MTFFLINMAQNIFFNKIRIINFRGCRPLVYVYNALVNYCSFISHQWRRVVFLLGGAEILDIKKSSNLKLLFLLV